MTQCQRELVDVSMYLENTTVCRRKWLINYFDSDCVLSVANPALCCDVCSGNVVIVSEKDDTKEATWVQYSPTDAQSEASLSLWSPSHCIAPLYFECSSIDPLHVTSHSGHIRILLYGGHHFGGQKCIAVIERKVLIILLFTNTSDYSNKTCIYMQIYVIVSYKICKSCWCSHFRSRRVTWFVPFLNHRNPFLMSKMAPAIRKYMDVFGMWCHMQWVYSIISWFFYSHLWHFLRHPQSFWLSHAVTHPYYRNFSLSISLPISIHGWILC